MHLVIFFYKRAHQNLSRDLIYLKQHIFYQNNHIIHIHLSQVKHTFLNLRAYLACPKLIWTVIWRDLMQVLSSNELLRGRIRKERPFFIFLFQSFSFGSFVLFFSQCDPGQLDVHFSRGLWERSGSVVECLTRDRTAAGSSLTGVTALWSLSKTHLS